MDLPRTQSPRRSPAKRGRRLAGPLAALASLLLLAPAPAAADTEQPRSAASFVDSIGVNVHTSYSNTPYGSRLDAVKARLLELGVRHVRDGLQPDRPDQYRALSSLAEAGIHSDLILGEPGIDQAGLDELVSTLDTEAPGVADAVEGPNELDMWGDTSEVPGLAAYQQALYGAIKGDPALSSLPVIGPALVQRTNQEAVGDISGSLDYGNIHSYPAGDAPEGNLGGYLERAAINSASKPVMATETGYHTGDGAGAVSDEGMATYLPRLYLEYFRRDVARTYSYELVDEGKDVGEPEDNYGLLRNDLSEKPAFAALRNTIGILEDGGAPSTPEPVSFSLSGDLSDLHHLFLQKSDGSLYLALWRAVDAGAGDSGVQISFGRRVLSAELYQPNLSASPLYPLPSPRGRPISLPVGPRVEIVRLALGAAEAKRIRLWVARRPSAPKHGRLALRGRLPVGATGHSLRIKIQRRQRGWRHWRTVAVGRASRSGVFRKRMRLRASRRTRFSRVRVVARASRPSRPVRVRVH